MAMPRRPASNPNGLPVPGPPPGTRLQRVLADAGIASRRACEELILAGRVFVNGRKVNDLPAFVNPRQDRIVVDGRPLALHASPRSASRRPGGKGAATASAGVTAGATGGGRRLYIMLHKPSRTVTTVRDEYGRRTVLDLVNHPGMSKAPGDGGARLFPVGRLDFETTGLVLLTNDGDLAHRLTHARYAVPKVYHVEVKGTPQETAMAAVEKEAQKAGRRAARRERPRGPMREDARGARVQIRVLPSDRSAGSGGGGRAGRSGVRTGEPGRVLEVTLAEGRNREVAPVLRRAGYHVKRIACVGLGPVRLRGLAVGEWRELDRAEVRALRRAAGLHESDGPRAKRPISSGVQADTGDGEPDA